MTIPKGLIVLCSIFILPVIAWSGQLRPSRDNAFTVYWENDSFTGTDRDYTNGLKLTWSRPYLSADKQGGGFSDWMMDHLPLMHQTDAQRATSFSIGQNIYTPEDTTRADVVPDDRPYAGFTYLGFGFVSNDGKRRDVWEFDIGIVGPLAHAEASQDWVHEIMGVDKAQGWNNQLENEIGLEIICESKWRLWRFDHVSGFGADFIPHAGGRIGNIAVYANAGAEVRLGWLMPQDFGTCPIRPGCNTGLALGQGRGQTDRNNLFGIHFFAAFEARAVARDIFLDGNTFQSSHSVDKEPFVADLMSGVAVHYGRWRINYTYVVRTREFEQQNQNHTFGAVSLTYAY